MTLTVCMAQADEPCLLWLFFVVISFRCKRTVARSMHDMSAHPASAIGHALLDIYLGQQKMLSTKHVPVQVRE